MKHWVLVVDAASSTIHETDERMTDYAVVRHESAAHAVHAHPHPPPHASGVHTAHQPQSDPDAHERSRFAHRVAEGLATAEREGRFERLIVVAPPRLLGELRADLSPGVARRVVAWVPHDLAHVPPHELPQAVRRHLPETAGMDA